MEKYQSPLFVFLAPVANSVITAVSATAVNTTLLTANAYRKMVFIYNDSTHYLFLKLGPVATPENFTVKMPPHSLFELPLPVYVGAIDGIWSGATGSAKVTELF